MLVYGAEPLTVVASEDLADAFGEIARMEVVKQAAIAMERVFCAVVDEGHALEYLLDMAQFDADGYYYIVGRKKRFLKIYGNRVNLDEIDRLIKGEFEIEVASAGVDDHMYIFVTDEKIADSVRDFVIGKTRLNPAAFKVIVIDEIPKNDSGKTLYKELTKYYAG